MIYSNQNQSLVFRHKHYTDRWLASVFMGLAVGLSGVAVAQGVPAQVVQTPSATKADADSGAVEEIVVTARKRDEKLIDTPVSVEALSGDELASTGTHDLTGLTSQIPQLVVTVVPSGSGAVFSIRGIGSPSTDSGVESTVSTVFDGVQLSRGAITSLGFFDTGSVQVLKGPQALYFGKNSPAGVIAVTSNGPTGYYKGYARVGYEVNAVEPFVEGAFGGPITQTLRFRVAAKYDQMNGYTTNDAQTLTTANPIAGLAPGYFPATATLDAPKESHWPTDRSIMGRVSLDWTPTEDFKAALHVAGAKTENDGVSELFQTKCAAGSDPLPVELAIPGLSSGFTNPNGHCDVGDHVSVYVNPVIRSQPLPFSAKTGKSSFSNFIGTLDSLDLNYSAGPISLTAISGLAYYQSQYLSGFDGQASWFYGGAQQEYRQASEEVRLTTKFKFPLNFVAGALYERSRLGVVAVTGLGSGLFPADPVTGRYDTNNINQAGDGRTVSPFVQGIWTISPSLELDAGARWTKETKGVDQQTTFNNTFSLAPGLLPVGVIIQGERTFYNLSPEATLTWHVADDKMLYGAFKSGYKSGGFSMPTVMIGTTASTADQFAFRPEKSMGGEIGAKGRFLDGRLQLTGAIYNYRYRDLQQDVFNATTTSFSIENAASATTRGVESDIAWRIIPELTANASLSYNRGRFNEYGNAACYTGEQLVSASCASTTDPHQDLSGTRLPYSSDFVEQFGLSWDRGMPMLSGYRYTLGSDVQIRSNFNTSPSSNPIADFGGKAMLGATIALYPESSNWKVELTGRNLLNENYITSAIDKPGGSVTQNGADIIGPTVRPREIWLQATAHFQ